MVAAAAWQLLFVDEVQCSGGLLSKSFSLLLPLVVCQCA
jgi:hypothetical protein